MIPGNAGLAGPVGMLSGRAHAWHMGIMIVYFRSQLDKAVHDLKGWRLAHFIDIGLVGQANDEDAAAMRSFSVLVQSFHRFGGNVV